MPEKDTVQEAPPTGVFISWSGDRSQRLARLLFDWLPDVLQSIKPFMSEKSIEAGEIWGGRLFSELSSYKCAILCVTAENTTAPWLLFEAGALTMAFQNTRVIPLLLDDTPENLEKPLGMLNAVTANEDGLRKLVLSVNRHTQNLEADRVARSFKANWPELNGKISTIPAAEAPTPRRKTDEMVAEILDTTRALERTLAGLIRTPLNATSDYFESLYRYLNSPASINPRITTAEYQDAIKAFADAVSRNSAGLKQSWLIPPQPSDEET